MNQDESKLLEGRIRELAQSAWQRDILRHTDFLSLSEQAVYHRIERTLSGGQRILYGGHPDADRTCLFFLPSYMDVMDAPPEEDHCAQALPQEIRGCIACIRIRAANPRFAEPLSHRDYLGALMNLGVDRAKTGDILTDGTGAEAYLFCTKEIAPFLCEELVRVRHTSVVCEEAAADECSIRPSFEELHVNVPSERADAVLAAVWKLSRTEAASLIAQEAVFADGRSVLQPGMQLKAGMRVSVRGYGKFLYDGAEHTTKKGRLYVNVKKYC